MATDELTAEQVRWAIDRVRQKDALHKEVIDIERICLSHELLRADRDRLREERDNAQTNHGLLADDYRDLQVDLRKRECQRIGSGTHKGLEQAMATDELTAEQVAEARRVSAHATDTERLCVSHESL